MKNVMGAAWNARDLALRTVPCALPTWCCLWMTAVAYTAVMGPIPLMPRTAVTAGTPQRSVSFKQVTLGLPVNIPR